MSPQEAPTKKFEVETSADSKDKLPELELRRLARTDQPINKDARGQNKRIEVLQPWNNFSIIIFDKPDRIRIIDENGSEVKDLGEDLMSTTSTIDLRPFLAKARRLYLGNNSQQAHSVLNAEDLPPMLRDVGLDMVRRGIAKVPGATWAVDSKVLTPEPIDILSPDIRVFEDGKYILVGDKEKGPLFCFVTQNDVGVILAPRNWKRVGLEAEDEKLLKYFKIFKESPGGYIDIPNNKYGALVNDVGINIVTKDNVKGKPVFSDNLPGIKKNIVIDPTNPNILFYCRGNNPTDIVRLDMSGEPDTWSPVAAELPNKYDSMSNLQLDPSGQFFLFYSKEDLVIITKDTLEEVKRVPGLTNVNFDGSGRIRAVDKDGHLVIYEPGFEKLAEELDKRRVKKLASGIKITDIFQAEALKEEHKKGGSDEAFEYLKPLRAQYEDQFKNVLGQIATQEDVRHIRQGLNKLRDTLRQQGLKPNEVAFIIEGLEEPIAEKEKEFAQKAAKEAIDLVKSKIASGLSIASVSEARAALDPIKAIESILDPNLRREVKEVSQELEQHSLELFRQRGGEVIKDVRGILERTRTDLEGFTSKGQMDDWLEFRYPQIKSRLGMLAKDVPLEADEAYKAIVAARTELQNIAQQFEDKFKLEYAKIREKAVDRIESTVDTLEQDIVGLIERLRSKGFADRKSAEQYLESSEARRTIEAEVAALSGENPDVAKELERALKVKISNTLTEIERGAMTQVAETGQQMVLVGETLFPKWEAKIKEKTERKVDLTFEEDTKSHGPGVKAGDILGDVALFITTSTGQIEKIRLYQGNRDENEWRFGLLSYRGEEIPASYLSVEDFKKVKKDYSDWQKGEKSTLRKSLETLRGELREIYSERQKTRKRTKDADEDWKKDYQEKLQEYAKFCAENHIALLRQIDRIKLEPEIEHSNGKGFVPEWQSHWVMDPQTEKDLEEMAKALGR